MPTARKLKSGSWRCQIFLGTETVAMPDGTIREKQIKKSFTVSDPSPHGKKECERLAAEWSAEHSQEPEVDLTLTFEKAAEKYIDDREAVLSPCSIKDYRLTLRKYINVLRGKKISQITQNDIQKEINRLSANHSPKTVRNVHALITSVMRVYRPNFAIHTVLPKPQRPKIYVPSDAEIQRLIDAVKGTNLELPVLLAAFGPMRRGEIAALRAENISGNTVHVCENMVTNGNGGWTIKAPKSYAGDRYIEYPDFVAEKWKGKTKGRLCEMSPNTITNQFSIVLKRAGLPHFRFHDLRHYAASIQHAIGIPDVYIMHRGGWGDDGTLKEVYRHVMNDKEEEMNQKANDYFSALASGTGKENDGENQ